MKPRRAFLKLAVAGFAGFGAPGRAQPCTAAESPVGSGAGDRAVWIEQARRLAMPLLSALAARRLKATMPVEMAPRVDDRRRYSHLEALGRLLAGLAPWLELGTDATPEGQERGHLATLARAGIEAATDPDSPDFMNFSVGRQPLVDAAFLAQALLRAPRELWQKLSPPVRRHVVSALTATRVIEPNDTNYRLFATEIEVFLHTVGERRFAARLFGGLEKFEGWYLGDGHYGDGPEFHFDYYNSFVIHPMLFDALRVVGHESARWRTFRLQTETRLARLAAIQERSIAPDGSFPAVGRSITYRCGVLHALALASWQRLLPSTVPPAHARMALTRAIRRTLEAPGTYDDQGWLRIGLAGHQPSLAEHYISTGSLYLCSFALLPLGLPANDLFWATPATKSTWERIWSGEDFRADKALPTPVDITPHQNPR